MAELKYYRAVIKLPDGTVIPVTKPIPDKAMFTSIFVGLLNCEPEVVTSTQLMEEIYALPYPQRQHLGG